MTLVPCVGICQHQVQTLPTDSGVPEGNTPSSSTFPSSLPRDSRAPGTCHLTTGHLTAPGLSYSPRCCGLAVTQAPRMAQAVKTCDLGVENGLGGVRDGRLGGVPQWDRPGRALEHRASGGGWGGEGPAPSNSLNQPGRSQPREAEGQERAQRCLETSTLWLPADPFFSSKDKQSHCLIPNCK